MPRYLMKTPLKTAEGTVPPGETVDLPKKDGDALVACKAAEKVADKPAAKTDDGKPAKTNKNP